MFENRWILLLFALSVFLAGWFLYKNSEETRERSQGRQEVVFWHFWGGEDRTVVEQIVQRFNSSQEKYYVRPVAMPGNNLNLKILASVAGGNPPDLVNIDDPVVGDWALKKVITPLDAFVEKDELKELDQFLVPSAKKLGTYRDKLYGVCNGLDLRALFINKTVLDSKGYSVPENADDLFQISRSEIPLKNTESTNYFPYLPDSRRLWSWGFAFGGKFYHAEENISSTASEEVVDALDWMKQFPDYFGSQVVSKFRSGDQSLPGKRFPLLPLDLKSDSGRYWMIQDGQWRVRDLMAFNQERKEAGLEPIEFIVRPLPRPKQFPAVKKENAYGWVNGNVFVVPSGSGCKEGAWEFMKFWIGLTDQKEAAKTCSAGGWIPVSSKVSRHPDFQEFLKTAPLFGDFVQMSHSPNWSPIPVIPGAARFRREVELAAGRSFQDPKSSSRKRLTELDRLLREHLKRASK